MIRTTSAWLDRKEVVEVTFDPRVTRFSELLAAARCVKNPSTVYVQRKADLATARKVVGKDAVLTNRSVRPAKDSDQMYYLQRSPYWFLPLTWTQAARLNAVVGGKAAGVSAASLLSPGQKQLLQLVQVALKDKAKAKRVRSLAPVREPAAFRARAKALRLISRN